jgi:hypothetical protein
VTPIQVVGIGLDGAAGLTPTVREMVHQASVLVGSDRHLAYFPPAELTCDRWPPGGFGRAGGTAPDLAGGGNRENPGGTGLG